MATTSQLHIGVWLILTLCFNPVAAFAQTERNLIHNAPLGQTADAARVIVKFKQDSILLRKHALSATAGASKTLDAVMARASSLGARLGMSLHAGRALSEHTQVISMTGISSAALAERLGAELEIGVGPQAAAGRT